MKYTQMKGYTVREIAFRNNIEQGVELKLNHKVTYNVKYSSNGTCEGTLLVELTDKAHPDVLFVKVVVSGMFLLKNEGEKELIHIETFHELFPFAKALVTTVTANAGIKPIIVENIDIESQKIYRLDMDAAREGHS